MKKLTTIFLVLTMLILTLTVTAFAGEDDPPIFDPTIKKAETIQYKTNVPSDEFSPSSSIPSNSLISMWGGGLSDEGKLLIDFSAHTDCYRYNYKGTLTMYLQKWNGSTWQTILTKNYVGYNEIIFYDGYTVSVSSAGYYRLKVTHYVENGEYYEYQYTCTNSIYVD